MITESFLVISPAYGRDYKSRKEVLADLNAGKDFIIESLNHGRRYCNIQDFTSRVMVEIRYCKKSKVMVAYVGKK